MGKALERLRKGYGKKLVSIHMWNAWLVLFLAVSGLLLVGGFWRELLGEGRVWLKWAHIGFGLVLLVPVIYYLLLAAKHWKRLKGKGPQKANVIFVLVLLIGWIVSGIVLWQFRLTGPRAANAALFIHDLLTWVGLPAMIYHSITRVKWLKEPKKRSIVPETALESKDKIIGGTQKPAAAPGPQPMYSRRGFIKACCWRRAGRYARSNLCTLDRQIPSASGCCRVCRGQCQCSASRSCTAGRFCASHWRRGGGQLPGVYRYGYPSV
ncbi:Prokaryotic cytochrome b561 [compost metagenome]